MPRKITISLDDMLEPAEAAEWLGMEQADLNSKTRKNVIPMFKIGHKTRRFHPRTIIAKLARDAGVPMETIAASFGIKLANN